MKLLIPYFIKIDCVHTPLLSISAPSCICRHMNIMHACYGSFTFSSHVLEIKMDCPPKGMVGFTGYCIIERCVSSYHVKVYPVHSFFCRMQKVIRAYESICLWGVDRRLCLVKGVWGFWGPQTALFFKAFDYGFICMINVQYSTSMISPFLVSCILAFGFAFLLGDTVWCLCTPDRDLTGAWKRTWRTGGLLLVFLSWSTRKSTQCGMTHKSCLPEALLMATSGFPPVVLSVSITFPSCL